MHSKRLFQTRMKSQNNCKICISYLELQPSVCMLYRRYELGNIRECDALARPALAGGAEHAKKNTHK